MKDQDYKNWLFNMGFITKNQIESMGGRIEVESKIDIGTTFRVYLKKR